MLKTVEGFYRDGKVELAKTIDYSLSLNRLS
jgi:hypothetical protein